MIQTHHPAVLSLQPKMLMLTPGEKQNLYAYMCLFHNCSICLCTHLHLYSSSFDSNESKPSRLNEVFDLIDNEQNQLHSVGMEEQAGWVVADMRSKGTCIFLVKVLAKFFEYFLLESPLRQLADVIPDPERKRIKRRRFFSSKLEE